MENGGETDQVIRIDEMVEYLWTLGYRNWRMMIQDRKGGDDYLVRSGPNTGCRINYDDITNFSVI